MQLDRSAIPASIRCIENFWRKKIKINDENIAFDSFSAYTLRKTARTNFSNFGEWAVCEKMIGHKLPGESDNMITIITLKRCDQFISNGMIT